MSAAYTCRSCGSGETQVVLTLGQSPLANSLLTREQLSQPEACFPLDLAFCRSCTLAQITETVPAAKLFSHYPYFSSISDSVVDNAAAIASRMIARKQLGADHRVIEAGSNDGYLLQHYAARGVDVLGVDPARNIVAAAYRDRGVPTLCDFFGREVGRRLRDEGKTADVFHANNVLAHVSDVNGFVEGIGLILKPGGTAVIEVPYVGDLVDGCEFDTIYHEHLCYFSLGALHRLFARHGLAIDAVERLPIHGGSLRLFVMHADAARPGDAVAALLSAERDAGMDRPEFFLAFAARVAELRAELRRLLQELKRGGARIAAYGASAKGSTLLSYCGIGAGVLDFVVDRSPHKQGLFMPGVHLPIYHPARLLDVMPEYVLLLTWNCASEIMTQQADYIARGGRFVVPVPHPVVSSASCEGERIHV